MNGDLISRSALLEDIAHDMSGFDESEADNPGLTWGDLIHWLQNAPAVDAVEVVRCKDCEYWDFGDCYRLELSSPDDFCSHGKRKNDGN